MSEEKPLKRLRFLPGGPPGPARPPKQGRVSGSVVNFIPSTKKSGAGGGELIETSIKHTIHQSTNRSSERSGCPSDCLPITCVFAPTKCLFAPTNCRQEKQLKRLFVPTICLFAPSICLFAPRICLFALIICLFAPIGFKMVVIMFSLGLNKV